MDLVREGDSWKTRRYTGGSLLENLSAILDGRL